MPRTQAIDQAFEFALDHQGIVSNRQLIELGIDPALARQWNQRGRVERLTKGVYRFTALPPSPLGPFLAATEWAAGKGVISHQSALQLLALADVEPAMIHLTVPTGYWPRRAGGEQYVVHHENLAADEIEYVEGVRVVVAKKAIEQVIGTVPPHLIAQAIETGRRRGMLRQDDADRLSRRIAGTS